MKRKSFVDSHDDDDGNKNMPIQQWWRWREKVAQQWKRYLLISSSDYRQLLLDPWKLSLQLRHPFAWPDYHHHHHHHHHGDDGDDEEENDDDLLSIIARFSTSWMEILFFLLITPLRISSTFTFKVWSSWSWDDGDDDPLKIHPSSISIRMLRAMKTIWNLWGWWWRRDL